MKFQLQPTKPIFASCIFLMLTLAWLTVSLPFLNAVQQTEQNSGIDNGSPTSPTDEENENPLVNTTEEKTPGTSSVTEEYLHDSHSSEQYLAALSLEYRVEHVSTYIAFYGELISPPPDAC